MGKKPPPRLLRAAALGLGLSALLGAAAFPVFVPTETERALRAARRYVTKNARAEREMTRLAATVKTLAGPPWAGAYKLRGPFDGQELIVLPGRYCFEEGMDMYDEDVDSWTRTNCGALKQEGDSLLLKNPSPLLGERLLIVPWEARTYLIEPERLPAFAEAIAVHAEPRKIDAHGGFLMRAGAETKPPAGLPAAITEEMIRKVRRKAPGGELRVIMDGAARAKRAVRNEIR